MKPVAALLKEMFMLALSRRRSLTEFEQWVYENADLCEQTLSLDDYLTLLTADYSKKVTFQELEPLLMRYLEPGEFDTWHLMTVLRDLLREDADQPALLEICDIYLSRGYGFLHKLGYSYAIQSYHESESDHLRLVQALQADVRHEARHLLDALERGDIILTGNRDKWGWLDYIDRRSD